jgi:hypothetical protein
MSPAQGGSARQMASNGTGMGAGALTRLAACLGCSEISDMRRRIPTASVGGGAPCRAAALAACLVMLSLVFRACLLPRAATSFQCLGRQGEGQRPPRRLGWGCLTASFCLV